MRVLYINGHPDLQSFHAAIRDNYLAGLVGSGHEIKVLNLGELRFDPVLRYGYRERMPEDPEIIESQRLVQWADHLVFAFPVWWGDAPALLKGWIERVFTPGVANHCEGLKTTRLLSGKTADIIATQRGVRLLAWLYGNCHISILHHNLFKMSGIKLRKNICLDKIGLTDKTDTSERRAKFLAKVAKTASSL